MKKLLILFFAIFPIPIIAQAQSKYEKISNELTQLFDSVRSNFIETEKGIKFSKVIECENIKKDNIYTATLEAISRIYNNSKEAIQNNDKDAGFILIKGYFSDSDMSGWGVLTEMQCEHTIKIEIKDFKYRISLQVDEVETTVKNGLNGNIVRNETHNVKSYFPFWKECPLKSRESSFLKFWFCYERSASAMLLIETEIKKAYKDVDSEW